MQASQVVGAYPGILAAGHLLKILYGPICLANFVHGGLRPSWDVVDSAATHAGPVSLVDDQVISGCSIEGLQNYFSWLSLLPRRFIPVATGRSRPL